MEAIKRASFNSYIYRKSVAVVFECIMKINWQFDLL